MIAERLIPKRNSLEVNKNDWVNKYVKKIGSNQVNKPLQTHFLLSLQKFGHIIQKLQQCENASLFKNPQEMNSFFFFFL